MLTATRAQGKQGLCPGELPCTHWKDAAPVTGDAGAWSSRCVIFGSTLGSTSWSWGPGGSTGCTADLINEISLRML